MKVQVIYNSLSGCTRRLAEGIFAGLNGVDKTLHDLRDGAPALDGDILLLGYWVDKGGPNEQMKQFMQGISGKTVGVFCTLAYFADSTHAYRSALSGAELLQAQGNTILGNYVCNGAISQAMIERFRRAPAGSPHSATPENEIRWALLKDHPTPADIALAQERFAERVALYARFTQAGLPYRSIV